MFHCNMRRVHWHESEMSATVVCRSFTLYIFIDVQQSLGAAACSVHPFNIHNHIVVIISFTFTFSRDVRPSGKRAPQIISTVFVYILSFLIFFHVLFRSFFRLCFQMASFMGGLCLFAVCVPICIIHNIFFSPIYLRWCQNILHIILNGFLVSIVFRASF